MGNWLQTPVFLLPPETTLPPGGSLLFRAQPLQAKTKLTAANI